MAQTHCKFCNSVPINWSTAYPNVCYTTRCISLAACETLEQLTARDSEIAALRAQVAAQQTELEALRKQEYAESGLDVWNDVPDNPLDPYDLMNKREKALTALDALRAAKGTTHD